MCVPLTICGHPPPDTADSLATYSCDGVTEGSKCSVQCATGFGPNIGDFSCLQDGTWQMAVGVSSRCSPLACSFPGANTIANAQDVSCTQGDTQSIPDGSRCTVQCITGYVPYGSHSCTQGAFTEVPGCFPEATQVRSVYDVFGRMELQAYDFILEKTEMELELEIAIAEQLVGAIASDVSLYLLQERTIDGMKLLKYYYTIRTIGYAFAQQRVERISTPGFENLMKMGLEVRIPGLQVGITVGHVHIQTKYEEGENITQAPAVGKQASNNEGEEDSDTVILLAAVIGAVVGGFLLMGAALGLKSWVSWCSATKDSELSFEGLIATIDARAASDPSKGIDISGADEREDWVSRYLEHDRHVDKSPSATRAGLGEVGTPLAIIKEDPRREVSKEISPAVAVVSAPEAEARERNPIMLEPVTPVKPTGRCCNPGCPRQSWNGKDGETCCRSCTNTKGARHGPDCEKKFQEQSAITPIAEKAPEDKAEPPGLDPSDISPSIDDESPAKAVRASSEQQLGERSASGPEQPADEPCSPLDDEEVCI